MLFRNSVGQLIELKRLDFTNDASFYATLFALKTKRSNLYDYLQANTSQAINSVSP